ncbi:MAG: glycoside hydrolase family 28 protein [Clostridiales bacterium]|nr:glycoside hydrolase family 28 protein [Clostridiales bacterium]
MEFKIIFKTSRKITVELINGGIYYADEPYRIYLDGKLWGVSDKVVCTVDGLKPDTGYEISLENTKGRSAVQAFRTDYEFVTLNVRRFGAKGDGEHDDTLFIQAAINACPKDSRVLIPKGVYRVSTLFLKSDVTIDLDEGAVLSAYTDRSKFPILPGLVESYDETQEYNLGTWEGNPLNMFASIITGLHVSNVVITGRGVIEGNASFENWWEGDGRLPVGGAFRPRVIFLNHCENVTVEGLTVKNGPAWNLHPYFSNNTRWIGMSVICPKVSPNTDGMDPESVNGLEVVGMLFSLGDDCIAMKSGKYYMGHKYKVASQNVEIRQCYMRYGHGSVTLGSETAAGVKNLVCRDCIFEATDRGLRIKTRRGRGEDSVIENIVFENIRMKNVLTPFVVNSYYWCCDPDGRSEYVSCKEPLPVDERTPRIRQLTFRNIEAHDCHAAASFIYGLPEAKIEEVTFENVSIDFAENPVPEYPAMMAGVDKCTRRGIYVNNVKKLTMNNVKVTGADGDAMEILNVDEMTGLP